MPRSLTRVEDWARAEAFAKRTSSHYRISAEPEQHFCSANYLDGEWASRKAARHGNLVPQGQSGFGGRKCCLEENLSVLDRTRSDPVYYLPVRPPTWPARHPQAALHARTVEAAFAESAS